MKTVFVILLATMLTACGTVRGTASGFVGGVGIDVNTVGDGLGSLADKIKPADYDAYEWYGHHGSEGNHNWYNKIIQPKMQQLKWI